MEFSHHCVTAVCLLSRATPVILSSQCFVKTPCSPLSVLSLPGRGGNLTLLHFLLGLKTAADDELVAELVVNILKVCPDLLNKYFKEVTFSFLPRVQSTWSNNIKLLNKVKAMGVSTSARWGRGRVGVRSW